MLIPEKGVHQTSERYFFTPSSLARELFYYPTRGGHYFCSSLYSFDHRSEIAMQGDHNQNIMLFYIHSGAMELTASAASERSPPPDRSCCSTAASPIATPPQGRPRILVAAVQRTEHARVLPPHPSGARRPAGLYALGRQRDRAAARQHLHRLRRRRAPRRGTALADAPPHTRPAAARRHLSGSRRAATASQRPSAT